MACCCDRQSTKVRPFKDSNNATGDEPVKEFEGPLKERTCRDVPCCIIMLLFICGMGYVSYMGVMSGNPYRLIYGVDSWGNVCNQDNDAIAKVPLSGQNMKDKSKIFRFKPVQMISGLPGVPKSYVSDPDDAVVCVAMCPNKTLLLPGQVDDFQEETGVNLCRHDVTSYDSSDKSKCPGLPITKQLSIFNRCIPESMVALATSMATTVTSALNKVTLGSHITEQIVSDLKNTWKDILYLCAISVGVALVMVVMLKFLAAIIIWMMVILVAGLCLAATGYSWYTWYSKDANLKKELELSTVTLTAEQTEQANDNVRTWMIYSAVASAITVVVLLLLLIMRKRIGLVVQLFKEAGKALGSMPFLLLQPFWTLIFLGGSVAGLAAIFAFVETSGIPKVDPVTSFVKFEQEPIWTYLRWYHFFGILWISAFIVACQDVVIAGAVATWFFNREKKNMGWPILASIKRLIRYHLGSVAFGSFIIALVRLLRFILAQVQRKLQGRVGKIAEFVMKTLQCCLWCFEKCLQYLCRNAYIEIAIYGYNFCTAARKAFMLILANALRVAAINSIGDFVLFLGKLSTVAIIVVVGNEFLKDRSGINYIWVPITVACAFAFAVAHCFLLVYEITIDTIFLCFCEDIERNNGADRPYFMSKNLMEYLDASEREGKGDKQPEKRKSPADDLQKV